MMFPADVIHRDRIGGEEQALRGQVAQVLFQLPGPPS